MPQSPQDVYARHLVSDRGYPLWTPEPNMNLPDDYLQEGLRIGDVGVVVPQDGSFDVFFNICLHQEHSLHEERGVPDNFTRVLLRRRDIAEYPEAESAGRVISSSSMPRANSADTPQEDPERRTEPGLLNYEFTLSSSDGAALILPEGAERYYILNERPFLDQAIQHAVEWYTFAEQRLGRIISHDSLYLITGFYKARSWSLAAYQQRAGRDEASAKFKAVQVGAGNVAACYTWETAQALDWRVGPSDRYYNGTSNQTVFIQGLKIAIREGILGPKWVDVKADNPTVRPYRVEFSSGSWFSSLWSGLSGSGTTSVLNTSNKADVGTDANENDTTNKESDNVGEDIVIRRFPQVAKLFHPADIINQLLLQESPSATVAVTHDRHWTTLLERGMLQPGEVLQKERLLEEVINNYLMAEERGVVYLQSREMGSQTDGETARSQNSDTAGPINKAWPGNMNACQILWKRRALLVAVRHVRRKIESKFEGLPDLDFAHRDAQAFRDYLITVHGYQADEVTLMMDSREHPKDLWPTREKILTTNRSTNQRHSGELSPLFLLLGSRSRSGWG
ncbi:hypothetical protein JVU11DRAFT_5748 [Chiua virens]|nr:hypothetical protein JVU11DRAFT_5748 [Chiua virens]